MVTEKIEGKTITPKELSVMLRLSLNATYEALRNGTIPSFKIGDRYIISRAKIDALLNGDVKPAANEKSQ